MGAMLFYRMVRDGLSEEVTQDQRVNNGKTKPCIYLTDRGNSRCKGPEVGICLAFCRNTKEARRFKLCE